MMVEKKKGFTLIELLVVIAIIALLLSIVMPGLRMAKQKARKMLCLSNHRQVGIGLLTYTISNDEKFPTHPGQGGNGAPYFYVQNKNNLADDILSYVGDNPEIFVCPLAPKTLPPDRTLRASDGKAFRWNFYYMANYKNTGLDYESPITSSTASGTNGLWSEHTADVGSSWGNIRASHIKGGADGKWPPTPDTDYGPSYRQWSVTDDKQVDDVSCLFADGSSQLLGLKDMYYVTTGYGGNWYPPAKGYRPSEPDHLRPR